MPSAYSDINKIWEGKISVRIKKRIKRTCFYDFVDKSFNPDMSLNEIIECAVEEELILEDEFAFELATHATENIDRIDAIISDKLTKWTIGRLPKVSLAILRVAIAEMLYIENVPVGVSINEAVEIAKKFAAKEDASFINGVLGNIARSDLIKK